MKKSQLSNVNVGDNVTIPATADIGAIPVIIPTPESTDLENMNPIVKTDKIDWKAKLKPEHFVINRQYEKELIDKLKKPLA